jgi:homogentisate 1,2-dioxygenase
VCVCPLHTHIRIIPLTGITWLLCSFGCVCVCVCVFVAFISLSCLFVISVRASWYRVWWYHRSLQSEFIIAGVANARGKSIVPSEKGATE